MVARYRMLCALDERAWASWSRSVNQVIPLRVVLWQFELVVVEQVLRRCRWLVENFVIIFTKL